MPRTGTMQERAYDMLRTYILNLVLEPGTSIAIQEMADLMEVSRTPVREALIRLQKDALVRFTPQRDTLITRIDPERVRQERFMREHLEIAVLKQFLEVEVPDVQVHLDSLIAQQRLAVETKDAVELIRLDDAFHSVFYSAIGQSLTWEMLGQYNTHYRRARLLNMRSCDARNIVAEHQKLLQALRDKDFRLASARLLQHLHNLDSEMEGLCAAYPNYFLAEDKNCSIFKLV